MLKSNISMDDLLVGQTVETINVEDIVEGTIIAKDRRELWLDLGQYGTGVVSGRDVEHSAKELQIGDVISASVIDAEDENGYVLLSLKKVAKEKGWDELESRFKNKEVFGIIPFDANKGGLLIEIDGVRGFLPVSQLSSANYPRVTGADKDEILHRLNTLVGRTLMIRILDFDRREGKLIVSEKEAQREFTEGKIAAFKVGDTIKGVVTGVVDFGVFVNIDGIEGLVHISEIAWDRVDNPSKYVKVGQEVEAMIIAIDQDKLSLSMKQLSDDPWQKEIAVYKMGDTVDGKVTRITPFGAFVQVTPVIEALVHISELADDHVSDPNLLVKVGETKKFRVISIDADQHKLSLSLKSDKPTAEPAKLVPEKTKKIKEAPIAKSSKPAKAAKKPSKVDNKSDKE
ncbi:S1 RNA-binding domain-containing protein [Candidatus Saccharibacteria bacterium]|nr:S1 RNA-binding domain-containing protein [Candidatus Saccharibacteria bacterium]